MSSRTELDLSAHIYNLTHTLAQTSSSSQASSPTPSSFRSPDSRRDSASTHVISLSSIEHCMPRAYIRVCLTYGVPQPDLLNTALCRLSDFVRKLVDAKPYLSGYLVPATDGGAMQGRVEICFTDEDFVGFPSLSLRRYSKEEMPYSYEELDREAMPPSIIRPELVSALPEGADDHRAPVFRVQANILQDGLIVSFYLHHCISDGHGLGLLISGSVMKDDFSFTRHLESAVQAVPSLTERLNTYAIFKAKFRGELSWSHPNQISTRHLHYRFFTPAHCVSNPVQRPGRGCIFVLPDERLEDLRERLSVLAPDFALSKHDALHTLLWHTSTRARLQSLEDIYAVRRSNLLIPINVRSRLKQPKLHNDYFGSAVDFALTTLSITHLLREDDTAMAATAVSIREAIGAVDDNYIRAAIALANSQDTSIDVRDLLASNMNRITGADMYITSWSTLPLYTCDLEMGLGPPDWVRKPWSKDPGSCIILPRAQGRPYMEVVVQLTEADMSRLLADRQFMRYVVRRIE